MKNPSSLQQEFVTPSELAGQRLDLVLTTLLPMHSRSRIQYWIKQGSVKVNNKVLRAKDKLQSGDKIILAVDVPEITNWSANDIHLEIVYEDEAIIVINKPVGLVVHPAAGNLDNTLANALLHYLPVLTHVSRAGIVHRLDKETSGLLVVAKTLAAHTALVEQLQKHEVQREYVAIVNGVLISGGTINAPIGRHPQQRQKMAVVVSGKPAVTHYRVIERFRAHTLIKVILETGRTHQIRVHLSHRGYPLLGDTTYGARAIVPKEASPKLIQAIRNYKHQALHAKRLILHHPLSMQLMTFEAVIPGPLNTLIGLLRSNAE
jgi:23S rRNA pseudouridine1911/1915/1917 synthase